MAEIHEFHEVDEVEVPVERKRRGFALPLLMFLLGGAIIAAVVVAVLNVQSTITWPAGQVSLGPNTAVATLGNSETVPPAAVTAPVAPVSPTVSTDGDSEAAEPAAPSVATPPAETTPPAATDESATTPPADSTTTPPPE